MSKLDETKEEINWLGRWFNVFVLTAFALIGWLALNYKTADFELIIGCLISVGFLLYLVYFVNKKAIQKIRELKDIEK